MASIFNNFQEVDPNSPDAKVVLQPQENLPLKPSIFQQFQEVDPNSPDATKDLSPTKPQEQPAPYDEYKSAAEKAGMTPSAPLDPQIFNGPKSEGITPQQRVRNTLSMAGALPHNLATPDPASDPTALGKLPSRLDYAAGGAFQQLPFFNRVEALANATENSLSGKPFNYSDSLDAINKGNDYLRSVSPTLWNTSGAVGQTALMGPVVGKAFSAIENAPRILNNPWIARLIAGPVVGGATGAATGLSNSPDLGNTMADIDAAKWPAAIGAGMGLIPSAAAGIGAGYKGLANKFDPDVNIPGFTPGVRDKMLKPLLGKDLTDLSNLNSKLINQGQYGTIGNLNEGYQGHVGEILKDFSGPQNTLEKNYNALLSNPPPATPPPKVYNHPTTGKFVSNAPAVAQHQQDIQSFNELDKGISPILTAGVNARRTGSGAEMGEALATPKAGPIPGLGLYEDTAGRAKAAALNQIKQALTPVQDQNVLARALSTPGQPAQDLFAHLLRANSAIPAIKQNAKNLAQALSYGGGFATPPVINEWNRQQPQPQPLRMGQ